MKIRLDPETGLKSQDLPEGSDHGHAPVNPLLAGPGALGASGVAAQARVESLVLAALRGQLPKERELLPHEAQKLRPRHIAIIMRIAAGMTVPEASAHFGMTTVRINTILHHPDALKIMAALQSQAADKLSDVGARLQGYANEMLSTKVEILRTTKNENLKDRIASDILDRAGYGPRQKIDINATNRFILPQKAAEGLTSALSESDRIGEIDYRQFTGKDLSAGGLKPNQLESGAGVSSRPLEVPEQPSMVGSASPPDSPDSLEARKIA